jgi:hypothetical protein
MPCTGLKSYFLEESSMTKTTEDNAFRLDPKARQRTYLRIARWIDDCQREAERAYADGRSGYIGRIKLCAFVDDEGVSLRVESSLSENI